MGAGNTCAQRSSSEGNIGALNNTDAPSCEKDEKKKRPSHYLRRSLLRPRQTTRFRQMTESWEVGRDGLPRSSRAARGGGEGDPIIDPETLLRIAFRVGINPPSARGIRAGSSYIGGRGDRRRRSVGSPHGSGCGGEVRWTRREESGSGSWRDEGDRFSAPFPDAAQGGWGGPRWATVRRRPSRDALFSVDFLKAASRPSPVPPIRWSSASAAVTAGVAVAVAIAWASLSSSVAAVS